MSARPGAAGTTSLKTVIAVLLLANSFTLQKLRKKYTSTSTTAMARPGGVSSPWPLVTTYRPFVHAAHSHGHDAMYWTDASASTGITETMAIQFAQPAMKPTSEPCE